MTNERKRLSGVVVKTAQPKTVTVRVDRDARHPLYEKVIRSSDRYLVHDEIGCRPGDEVIIVESRPISKRKRWVIQEVVREVTTAEVKAREQEIAEPDILEPHGDQDQESSGAEDEGE